MLGVVYTVLKIILLIIGIILGIVLLLAAFLLFSPIKYDAFAKKEESMDIKGKASWLFGIIRAEYISNDEDSELILKYPFKKKEKIHEPIDNSAVYIQQLSEENAEEELKKDEPEFAETTLSEGNDFDNKIPEFKEETKKTGLKEKIQSFINMIRQKISDIKGLISRLGDYGDLISEVNGKYDIIGIIEKTIGLIKKLFKNTGFKVFEINGIIGFDDPSLTGKVLGTLAAADCIIPADIDIDGDFENKRLEGRLKLSGKTSVFNLLFPIAVYLLRKPVRPMVIDYIRGDKNE